MMYRLIEVVRFPPKLEQEFLYWSKEYEMCAHKCACGCGDTIYLPVDAQNYNISVSTKGVTLRPSVGNWGVCDAHYYITAGRIEQAAKWSPGQIATARANEDDRRNAHYNTPTRSLIGRMSDWIRALLKR